jgi:hypothetical protein
MIEGRVQLDQTPPATPTYPRPSCAPLSSPYLYLTISSKHPLRYKSPTQNTFDPSGSALNVAIGRKCATRQMSSTNQRRLS